ncbi:Thioldisulfide interchange protein DsbG [Salinisphaera shabanensis E1L3A]|uniref:Thiol:disulfide interchange protein n=1 Tax=Salinisphaera shabanensis E1L3A TaxID=1033802 RepID=U2G2M8_9GAMM|nr:thiol:disulfide interchange protein DsbG [Salinisphaera shabanensis]ERJ20443.1 Thioldisulfide interchange protein DsbG [Salinisphaera shabanensis E1L3A]
MRRLARPVVALGLLLATLPLALAAAAPEWPAPIRNIQDKGVTIVEEFDAPGGMTGYAARAGNRPLTLYLTPDGDHVIIGPMLDAEGNNLSQEILDATITQPDIQNAWPALEDSNWVADGADDAERKIYVFTDPNCPYCHKFYEIARPWVEAGKVQLRHIPVGILKPSSAGKAAAILGAEDPSAALAQHENNYTSGGITPLEDMTPALRQQVAANNMLMSSLGIQGTPGLVYRDDDGEIGIKQGVPQGKLRKDIMGAK